MRILLADDESNVRFGLQVLLEQRMGFRVVGGVGNLDQLWGQLEIACPDLLLLDWGFGDGSTGELLAVLRETCPQLAVIVLSGRPEARPVALAAGALAFVDKTDPPERLLEAIEASRDDRRVCDEI